MWYTVEVLVVIDDVNKIYYTEDKHFALNNTEAINQAVNDYTKLVLQAQLNGYQIIKREKNITPTNDEKTNEISERSK